MLDNVIIVTGANGYLGRYICLELLRQGYRVIGFSYDHYASVIIRHEMIEYVQCDIRKAIMPQVESVVRGRKIAAVINAAALLGSADYDKNFAVNAKGVEYLIDFSRQLGISRFIQISSVVVLKQFKGPYGETKLIGQQMAEHSGLDFTVFIPAMILGPESLGLNRILKNVFRFPLVVPIISNGSQTQHPIFVKDLAKYIVKSVAEKKTFNKVYQAAGEQVISFKDLIRVILKIKGKKKLFISVPPVFARMLGRFFQKVQRVPLFTAEHVKGILQDSNLDIHLIKNDLDFQPADLEEALKYSLNIIGERWNYFLQPRKEEFIQPD